MRRARHALATVLLAACSGATAEIGGGPSTTAASGTSSAAGGASTTGAAGAGGTSTAAGGQGGGAAGDDDAGAPDAAVDASDDAGDAEDIDRCPDGFPRGTTGGLRYIHEFSPALEGVAVCPNGDVFVSQPDTATIFRVPLDGAEPEVWTTLPGHQPLGMDCASDGVLYVADFGTKDASVFRVAKKGDPGTPLPKIPGGGGYGAMNAVAVVDGLGLFATDGSNSLGGRIVLFKQTSPGVFEASVARGGVAFPNDVAFDPGTKTLQASLTLESQVLSFPMAPDGALGDASVVWSGTPVVDAFDGLTLAEKGDRYVAYYLQGNVRRSSDGAIVASMAQPRSLAFRGGTLLVTAKAGLYAIDLAVCGVVR